MNKLRDFIKRINIYLSKTNLKFTNIVIAAISWGIILFIDVLTISFMTDFYKNPGLKDIQIILTLFLIIFICVICIIVLEMVLREASIFKLIIFISDCINILIAFLPFKLISKGLLENLNVLLDVFLVTDSIICVGIVKYFRPLRDVFVTKEVKKTYRIHGATIEETTKNYPIILPITVALITAGGAIFAALIER